jgi:hypothetical protein
VILKKTIIACTEPYTITDPNDWVLSKFSYVQSLTGSIPSRPRFIQLRQKMVDDLQLWMAAFPRVESFSTLPQFDERLTSTSFSLGLRVIGRFEITDDVAKNRAMMYLVDHPVSLVETLR